MGKRGAKKLTRAQGGPNIKSVLRHEHLKNLALWSTGGDTPIPSLATLFGRRLAADGEASDIPHDPDLFSCQRCETILQPGFNCNVRIEKVSANKKKHMRHKKKPNIFLPQNNVVYYCNFCSHRNLKRGTAKGQMKVIYPPKPRDSTRPGPKIEKEMVVVPQEIQSHMLSSSPERSENDQVENDSVVENTPKPMLTLERERRRRKSKSKKPIEPESVPEKTTIGGSNKRKRKAWTSMKDMAETSANKSSSAPEFVLQGVEEFTEKVAFLEAVTGKAVTYGDVVRDTKRLAKALTSLGLRKGQVMVVVLPNVAEYGIIALGIMSAGGVFSGANPTALVSEIKKQVEASGAKKNHQ